MRATAAWAARHPRRLVAVKAWAEQPIAWLSAPLAAAPSTLATALRKRSVRWQAGHERPG